MKKPKLNAPPLLETRHPANTLLSAVLRHMTPYNALYLSTIFCILCCFPAPTVAQETADARALFKQGNVLVRQGDYPRALEAFERSYEMAPKPVVLFNMGMCFKAMDRLAEAADSFAQYLSLAGRNPKPNLRKQAKEALNEIDAVRPRITFQGLPEKGEIVLDDRPARPFTGDIEIRPDPGRHRIKVTAPGRETFETEILASAGEQTTIALVMPLTSTLSVDCVPDSATISINGKAMGSCPYRGTHPPGAASVTISAPGSEPFEQQLILNAGQNTHLTVKLNAVMPEGPPTSRARTEADNAPAPTPASPRQFFTTIPRTVWFSGTVVMIVGGATMAGVTYFAYKNDANKLEALKPINVAGGTIASVGLGSLALFIITGLTRGTSSTNQNAAKIRLNIRERMLVVERTF